LGHRAIYAVTLELEGAAEDVEEDPNAASARIDGAIDRLGELIKDLRRSILGSQPADAPAHTLPEALAALLAETRAHTLLETELCVDSEEASTLPAALGQDLVQIAREMLANVVWHARAGCIRVTLDVRDNEAHMRIVDNGVGFDTSSPLPPSHHGLRNLRERARGLGGDRGDPVGAGPEDSGRRAGTHHDTRTGGRACLRSV
jgi:two-component system, NarL family, sensor histidine kinase LiaS